MTDFELPDLPSDEELGIDGLELDEDGDEVEEEAMEDRERAEAAPPTPSAGSSGDRGRPPPAERGPREPSDPPPPTRRWRGPATLVALVALAWMSSPSRSLPDAVPATAPDTAFSSARAMVELVELARRAHPTGSPEHARVRERVLSQLRELGLEPAVQTATSWVRRGESLRAATVRNVVARIPGTDPSGAVLVTAHYDGRTLSPAAGDDATGVVSILESLRALQAGDALRNDVVVLITDGEELGLLGARAFVRDHPWMGDVSVVLSVEMRGGGGPSIMFETGPDNGWIVQAMSDADLDPVANSISYEVYRRLPLDTDFTPFLQAGRQGLNFAAIGRGRVYHQAFDTPENVQEETVQHHGVHILGMLRELGSRDLGTVDAPDRVFFRLPVVGLVAYATLWTPLLGVVLLVGTVIVLLWSHRRGAGIGSLATGVVLGLLAAGGSVGAGWWLFRQVHGLHPEYGLLEGSAFHSEGWYVLAGVAGAFTLVTGLLGAARKRASLPGLAAGALVLPVLAALYLTFATPLAAMNLQWPALAGVAGAALVAGVAGTRPPGLLRWVPLLAVAAVVLAFMVPLVELVWMAMNVSILPVLAGLAALALLLLLPLLDALAEPNRWWAPLGGLLLTGGFLGVGLLHARPAADRPTPSTLAYALDRESGEARWISGPGPGLAWARERVGALEAETGLEPFLLGPGPFLAGPAPVAAAEPPVATTAVPGDLPDPRTLPDDSVARADSAAAATDAAVPDSTTVADDTAGGAPAGADESGAAADTVAGADPVGEADPEAADPAGTPDPGAAGDAAVVRDSAVVAEPVAPPAAGLVRVALRSRIGAERMTVAAAPGSEGLRWRAVNGRAVEGDGPIASVTHWGVPEGALLLDLEPPPGADSVRLVIVEHHLRPDELMGEEPFRRPPDLAPATDGISDRALIRSVVTLPVASGPATGGGTP